MSSYTFRRCQLDDVDNLLNFIRLYWNQNHIFLKSKILFDFQHFNKLTSDYNFLIAIFNETNEIHGILGIIPLFHYDPNLIKYNEAWGGIWKVREDVKNKELPKIGSILFQHFDIFRSHGSVGMSKVAQILHKFKKYEVSNLNQYFFLNKQIDNFNIATIPSNYLFPKVRALKYKSSINKINNLQNLQNEKLFTPYYPKKSINYLINRFLLHPLYKYSFLGIYNDLNKLQGIFVTRNINIYKSKVIRIVDFYGDLSNVQDLSYYFQILLEEEKAEYIDILNFGIDEQIFYNIGFEKLDQKSNIIIPNYFEPFVKQNIELNCAYRSNDEYVFFKADADQDRPNLFI